MADQFLAAPLKTLTVPKHHRVLLIGDSGTGKTRFAGSMVKPLVLDFDNGVGTLRGHDTAQVIPFHAFPDPWNMLKTFIKQVKVEGALPSGAETLVIDSLTFAADYALTYVLKKSGNPSAQPNVAQWGEAIREVKDLLADLTILKCHVLVTAHARIEKDELLGDLLWVPLIYGKDLPHRLAIFFDEVYMTTVVQKIVEGKKVNEFLLQVKPDARMKQLKSRLDKDGTCFSMYEKPDFTNLLVKAGQMLSIQL